MKKLLSCVLALVLVASCLPAVGMGVLADEVPISVTINGEVLAFDVPPAMINDRVLVPFRAIFEALGASVGWDEATQTASGEKDGIKVELVIDSNIAKVDGKEITLDVAATKINDRTLVPIRFISESLKAKVDWVEDTRTVVITYGTVIPEDPKIEHKPYKDSTFNANLIGQHPRLVVGSEISYNELMRRTEADAYSEFYKGVLSRGNSCPTDGEWIKSIGDLQTYQWRVQDAAMAYLITGEKRYFDRVKANTMKVISMDEWDSENGGGMSNAFCLSGISCAYDWCYDAFSADERAAIRDKIQLQMTRLKWAWENNTGGSGYWQGDYQNNHHQMRIAGMLFGAIAIMGETDDDSVILDLYDFVEQDLKTMVEWLGTDGDSDESPQYLVYGYEQVIKALTAYEGISGIDLFGKDSIKNIGNFKAYTYIPGFKDLAPWGDYSGGNYYFNNCFFKIASKNKDAQLQQLLLDAYKADPGSFIYPTWSLIFYDDRLTPEPWAKPGYAYFHNIEIANFRSGWADGDISLNIKSGPPGGHRLNEWSMRDGQYHYVNVAHSKPDANNIFISFAGKRWGEYPRYYKDSPTRLTRYHNTVIIDGKGQKLETNSVWAQPYEGMADEAFISEFFGSDGYGFATGSAAKAYEGVNQFDRSIFFVDNRYYVSFDEVENSTAGTMEYLFHNQGSWTGDLKNGYVITQDEDSMELFVTMPVEAKAVLSDPLEEEQRSKLGHELAVSNVKASTTAQFAAVYFPQLGGEKLPATPVLKTNGDVYELTVKRNGKTDIISIHKTGGKISAADVSANAKSMFYTKDSAGVTTAVMINGTELKVNGGITLSSPNAVSARYAKVEGGLKVWAAAPLHSTTAPVQLTVSGLEAGAAYTQTNSDGVSSSVTADAGGSVTLTVQSSQTEAFTLTK